MLYTFAERGIANSAGSRMAFCHVRCTVSLKPCLG